MRDAALRRTRGSEARVTVFALRLGDQGVDTGEHSPEEAQQPPEEDAPQANAGQGDDPHPSDHDGVDDAHGGVAQLAEHHRCAEPEDASVRSVGTIHVEDSLAGPDYFIRLRRQTRESAAEGGIGAPTGVESDSTAAGGREMKRIDASQGGMGPEGRRVHGGESVRV